MHPPWRTILIAIFFCFHPTSANGVKSPNGTLQRAHRDAEESQKNMPYNTYYLAHSYTNSAGIRRNVLIPVQVPQAIQQVPTTTPVYHDVQLQMSGAPHIHPNGIPPARPHVIPYDQPGALLLRLQHSNNIPVPTPQTYTATKNSHIIYAYRTPHQIKVPTAPTLKVKLPYEHSQKENKPSTGSIQLYPVAQNGHRFRPRGRPNNLKYTATKIQTNNEQSPYTNKVRFELEDARIPGYLTGIGLQSVKQPAPTSSSSYLGEQLGYQNRPSGLSQYLERENPRQLQHITPETPKHVEYVPQNAESGVQSNNPQIEQQHIHYIYETNEITPTPTLASPEHYPVTTTHATSPYDFHSTPSPQVQYIQEVSQDNLSQKPNIQYVTESNDVGSTPNVEVTYAQQKIPTIVEDTVNILKQTSKLPTTFTPDNIDQSIRTLALILEKLQQSDKIHKYPVDPTAIKQQVHQEAPKYPEKEQDYPDSSGSSTPGRPGIDYPIYSTIPKTQFDCATQRYKGFFGDPETHCQVWHYCDLNGGQASFLCPNGTIFNQVALTCDWWFNVRCSSTSQLYVLNERLYKYILPFSPSFPEDYSGPIVDRYLAAKFKEMEAKNRLKALKALITTAAPETSSQAPEVTTLANTL